MGADTDPADWYRLTAADGLARRGTDPVHGLTGTEADARRLRAD